MSPENAFLDPDFSIAWSRLTPDQIEPSIEKAIADAQGAIDAIGSSGAVPDISNTFLALERSTEELNVSWSKVSHLQSVADSPALRAAHNAMLPKVSAFFARIPLNPRLWQRLKAFAELPAAKSLEGVERRLMEETLKDFRQAGADLPEAQRKRLEAIQTELSQLTQKYAENVLDATNAWQLVVEDEKRLAGIPDLARRAARQAALAKGIGSEDRPAWRFTLQYPSVEAVMTYADDEALRMAVWEASIAVGDREPHDNAPLIQKILALRAEKAAVLGRSHFADLVLERRMAATAKRALGFIEELRERASVPFKVEIEEIERFKAERTGSPSGPLKAWEVGYWAEKLRRDRHDFDEEQLRPYFPMDRVIAGLFDLAQRVFGLRIEERRVGEGGVEAWHDEVRYYEMRDEAGRHVGSFYADWHPRESKRGGAWMGYLVTGGPTRSGGRDPHLGYICGNLSAPLEGRPALLTHREVQTIFHEFGHLLHHLLGEVPIKSLNGVNVAWDFVELPSQLMENWCWERESLDLFARHVDTGAPIPDELFGRMTSARNFRSATGIMRQVLFARLDLLLHTDASRFLDGDIEEKSRELVADCMIPTVPPGRTPVKRFTHIFGDPVGYAAGYYSYKWAEVLDADAFSRFLEEGVLNREVGARFVDSVLSRGNAEDPAVLFREFMGRDPDIGALLRRCGLASQAA